MSLKVAISAVIILLLAVLVVYPMFAPHPPVIDERQLVEPVEPIIEPIPEPQPIPEPKPIPDTPPVPPLVPPTQPNDNGNPSDATGVCPNGVCPTQQPQSSDGGLFWRLRARRGR